MIDRVCRSGSPVGVGTSSLIADVRQVDEQSARWGARVSYASAGVDIEAGDRAVELFKPLAKRASRPEVLGGLGGFAGLFSLRGGYREPVLASSTDGVGTKLAVAQAMDKHDTIGPDLVAMVVDDLVVCGAEPLFLQDYIAVGRTVPERVSAIVSGIAEGCVIAGCALLGGETAEHPGLMAPITTTSRRPGSEWSRLTTYSGRTGSGPGTSSSPWGPPVCTPTATRWPARCYGDRPDGSGRPCRGVRPDPR